MNTARAVPRLGRRAALHAPDAAAAQGIGEVVFEDTRLRIAMLPGAPGRVVIVFTGLGLGLGPVEPQEFVGSARGNGKRGNTVIFVSDKEGLWYEGEGVADKIRQVLRGLLADLKPMHLCHVGNSMGGYGAILFSRDTGAKRVLAFGPQYSIKPGVVPGETRWARAALRIGTVTVPSLAAYFEPGVEYVILHGLVGPDTAQAAQFPQAETLRHYLFEDLDHDTGRALKDRGTLAPLVAAALRGRLMRVDRLLREAGAVQRMHFGSDLQRTASPAPVPPALLGAAGLVLLAAAALAGDLMSGLGGGLITLAAALWWRQ